MLSQFVNAASFDCNKATTETEKAICAEPELSALDDLLGISWNTSKKLVSIDSQKKWLQKRDLCEKNNDCLRKEIGLRIGTLLAVSVGLSERIEETPFRYIKSTEGFVRCRKNYQGTKDLKFVEILFSFEENGPTFQETNIFLDGSYSTSFWDWLIWSATASNKQIATDEVYDQSILTRSYKVSREYVSGLKHGRLWNWIVHEDPARGASFTSFRFETSKIDECISFIENVISTVSNCSQEDRDYAAFWDNYYDPEVAYKFGETVQQILKRKDLSALLKLIPNELVSGFRKSDTIDAEFGDIISEEVVSNIISSPPECSPVGWRGHMLGNGDLWYSCDKNNCHIVSIHDTGKELRFKKEGFVLNGQTLSAYCFPYPWLSSDNFQEIADKFEIDIDDQAVWSNFFENTGMFFGNQITEYDISIVRSLENCGRAADIEIEDGRVSSSDDLSYQVVNSEINSCKELIPNLSFPVVDCRLIFLREETGGSMGSYNTHGIYGVIELPTIGEAVLPLKFFKTKNDALNFVDERK